MTSRKSMANILLESAVHSTPNISSPLRRKSILPPRAPPSELSENDDEAERLARRREITVTSTPLSSLSVSEKRRSLGLGFLAQMPSAQITERISECIKLGTENKINLKNAFSLEMIDFMTYMIKKQDVNMTNLQVASTSLDVSTKIYGFRVDGVHMEILKMIGGLDKQQEKADEGPTTTATGEQMDVQPDEESRASKLAKKKKKRNKQRIFSSAEALKIAVEVAKPTPAMMNEADLQTTDLLCQAMLPNHANSGFYQHQYNDVIVDVIDENITLDKDASCSIPRIEEFSQLEICPPLFNFDFQGWSADDEPEEAQPEENNENSFHFDLEASLPPDDEPAPSGMSYYDVENEQENIDRCARVPNQVENIVDFRQVLTATNPSKVSEYSFVQKSLNIHWAGPSHWKVSNLKKSLSNSRVVEVCQQAPTKKRKEIEMLYDDQVRQAVVSKFLPSQAVKLQARTAKTEWNEEKLTLPPDEHYDIAQASKLYLHPLVIIDIGGKDDMNTTHVSDGIDNYDYNNENDISNYCPDVNNGDYRVPEENNDVNEDGFKSQDEDCAAGTQIPLTGGNLVAVPKLANKTSIAYCLRAKKIDMRQLKKSIWKSLVSANDKENMNIQEAVENGVTNKMKGSKRFSEIYKTLPNMLSKTNAEALSFPISFVSLLHLANEKTLKIDTLPDMSDLIVEGD